MSKLKYGKKTGLIKFSRQDVDSWGPCYPAHTHLKDGVRYDAASILLNTSIPVVDRIWVVLRTNLVSEKLMRLFAVKCVREVQHLLTDQRSLNVLDVAERFASGLATSEELSAARDAAWDAAWDVANGVARDAARDAAWDAANGVARDAARDAAWDAAWDAANGVARDAIREKQVAILLNMVMEEGKQRVEKKK